MRPLSESELQNYQNWFKDQIAGAQLQDVRGDHERLVLELYRYELFWLVFDLNKKTPRMVFCKNEPPIKTQTTPLALFLASHAEGLFLQEMSVNAQLGRVVDLRFEKGERVTQLRVVLIPHAANAQAESASGKKIAFYRPSPLKEKANEGVYILKNEFQTADFENFERDYFEAAPSASPAGAANRVAAANQIEKQIAKKEQALKKIGEINLEEQINNYLALGESLKLSAEVLLQYRDIFDTKLSRSQNMRNAFEQAKRLREKMAGHDKRVVTLATDIEVLQKKLLNPMTETNHSKVKPSPKLRTKGVKVRTLQLKDGRVARFGKSATDNLKLLREARAWDIWVHLRDEPSSHGIIFCEKSRPPSDDEIRDVGRWIFFEKQKNKANPAGGKLAVAIIACECRFVRPLKGDRHGRVTYTNGRHLEFRV